MLLLRGNAEWYLLNGIMAFIIACRIELIRPN